MSIQADIDHDYRRIKILLEATDSFVLTFALYRDAKEQRENAGKLREMLELPITQVALKGDNLNPVRTFLDLPKEPRQAIFFTFLGSSLPEGKSDFDKFAGYVNIQREAFTDAPHAVVLWLREEQLVRLMRRAPDFWAWRSGVFDFRGELTIGSVIQRERSFTSTHERAQLEEQVALYQEILKSQLQRDEPDLAYIVRTRTRLAAALNNLGLFREMVSEAQEALSTAQMLGNEKLMADSFSGLAVAYHMLDNYDEAEIFYRKAITLSESFYGRHVGYVNNLTNLAELLTTTERYDEAEALLKEAVELAEKVLGKEHPSYSNSLGSFANLLATTGRYSEAESLYRKVIDLRIETFGKKHPKYATSIYNLARLLKKLGRYDEAEPLYREAIEITEKALGREHPNYSLSLHNLADLLVKMGRYDEAEFLFHEALEGCREYLGETHLRTKGVEEDYQHLKQELLNLDVERALGETV